ncbi:MAG: hypothetical protein CM1200mP22_26770 [Dehalococcoidia bacterium]|nr:MAG: hypothetical protein CM1200mP22_26770 [Dehalococcoidia bacterium]
MWLGKAILVDRNGSAFLEMLGSVAIMMQNYGLKFVDGVTVIFG